MSRNSIKVKWAKNRSVGLITCYKYINQAERQDNDKIVYIPIDQQKQSAVKPASNDAMKQ